MSTRGYGRDIILVRAIVQEFYWKGRIKDMGTEQYGSSYWCVKVPSEISKNGEIHLHADRAEVTPNGDLIFWSSEGMYREEAIQNLALAKGSWLTFFAASMVTGNPVAVEHWKGEFKESGSLSTRN